MVLNGDGRLDEFLTYLAVERFLESNFADHIFFYHQIIPKTKIKTIDTKSSINDVKEPITDGKTFIMVAPHNDDKEDLDGIEESEALRVTSESTLKLFAGMRGVCCVGCGMAAPRRDSLSLCSMCGLATCCPNCIDQFHNPAQCGYISSLIEQALSNSVQFYPSFAP